MHGHFVMIDKSQHEAMMDFTPLMVELARQFHMQKEPPNWSRPENNIWWWYLISKKICNIDRYYIHINSAHSIATKKQGSWSSAEPISPAVELPHHRRYRAPVTYSSTSAAWEPWLKVAPQGAEWWSWTWAKSLNKTGGGLEVWNYQCCLFPYLGFLIFYPNHPNWRSQIFQRGWNQQPVNILGVVYLLQTQMKTFWFCDDEKMVVHGSWWSLAILMLKVNPLQCSF